MSTGPIWKRFPTAVALVTLVTTTAACAQTTAELTPSMAAAKAALEVRYVANEGFLIEGGGKRVLIDGLFGSGVTGYPVASLETRSRIEDGTHGWGDVSVALASHYHPDHFEAAAVARFLRANPEAVFVSTPQAATLFRERHPDETDLHARFRAVLPAPGTVENLEIDGIRLDVLNLHHGAGSPPTENLGFAITLGARRFLHFGDTEAKMDDFEPYLELLGDTDLAILPFWFLSSAWRADMVRDLIRPRWILVGHMPLPDAPADRFARWNNHAELTRVIEAGFPDAAFPTEPSETFYFGD